MRYDVLLSEDAESDLEELWRHIAVHETRARADQVLDALTATWLKLEHFPERGNVPKELRTVGVLQYRELHWKPYRVIYDIRRNQVIVHCILDGRRDMQTLLQERLLR
ncbi:MAG: type II toxin-antitoxin system RelE/ParE family toxin [Proteobacteria bacterium]|nr:type II toxin-antitoxin system RelE/ParE family toxin [Pseudomonadota bacterium]